jgi:hypothetical protein
LTGRRDETKWASLTTEFWAMVVVGVTTFEDASRLDRRYD